jgi:ATP-dependent protease ClpP protease subunit
MIKTIALSGIVGDFWGTFNQSYLDWMTQDLKEGDTLEAIINSPGGDVNESSAMMGTIQSINKKGIKTIAKISGYAISAASYFVFAFNEIEMSKLSWMMIHNVALTVTGTASDLEKYARVAAAMSDNVADLYAKKTGKDKEEFLNLMNDETWFSAEQALEMGFIDRVDDQIESMVAMLDPEKFPNAPKNILNQSKGGSRMTKPAPEQKNENKAHESPATTQPTNTQQAPATAPEAENKGFNDGVNAERTRVATINKLALVGQENIAQQMVESGASIEDAKNAFLEDARLRLSQKQTAENSAVAPVVENHAPIQTAGDEQPPVDVYNQYNRIKDPIARNKFFQEHEAEIKAQAAKGA